MVTQDCEKGIRLQNKTGIRQFVLTRCIDDSTITIKQATLPAYFRQCDVTAHILFLWQEELAVNNNSFFASIAALLLLTQLHACSGEVKTTYWSSPSHAGTALLSWSSVTTYTDGSTLAPAGYRVYYGTDPQNYATTIDIPVNVLSSAATPTYTIQNLAPGTYYFSISVYDTVNVESALSPEVSKVIN